MIMEDGRTSARFDQVQCNMAAKASAHQKSFDFWKFSSFGILEITKMSELSDDSRKVSVERPTLTLRSL
jgi:hypothetical protein